MPVPSSIADLSTTAASNSPAGSDSIGTSLDDFLRSIQAILKQSVSQGTDITAAATITPAADGHYFTVNGSTGITAIGSTNSWNGRLIALRFASTPTITHNGSTLILPGGSNITAASGDVLCFAQESPGVWRCVGYVKSSGASLYASDIGSTVQAYDADTMKSDVETDITGAMTHTVATLTDGANIDWNLDTQQNATVTLGGNRVMNAPTNAKAGRFVGLRVVQDGTGGRTLTWNSAYKGMTGVTPVTTASAVNFYLFRCIDTTNLALVGFRSNCEA